MRYIKLATPAIARLEKDTAIWVKREVRKDLQKYEFAFRTDSGKQFEFRNMFGAGVILRASPYGRINERVWLKEEHCFDEKDARIVFEIEDVNVDRLHKGVSDSPWAWTLKMRVI